jgi:hypothetical protein
MFHVLHISWVLHCRFKTFWFVRESAVWKDHMITFLQFS